MSDNIKKQKRIIAEESQSPDRWLREPRNNQGSLTGAVLYRLH